MIQSERLYLKIPSIEDKENVWGFRQEFIDNKESIFGDGSLLKRESYEEWLKVLEKYKKFETLPEGKVITSQFLTYTKAENKLVGVVQVRHELNDYLLKFAGHIGDSVRKSERNKGYGTEQIELALKYAKSIGIKKALIVCKDGNIASEKTIINNGGVLENIVKKEGERYKRWCKIAPSFYIWSSSLSFLIEVEKDVFSVCFL